MGRGVAGQWLCDPASIALAGGARPRSPESGCERRTRSRLPGLRPRSLRHFRRGGQASGGDGVALDVPGLGRLLHFEVWAKAARQMGRRLPTACSESPATPPANWHHAASHAGSQPLSAEPYRRNRAPPQSRAACEPGVPQSWGSAERWMAFRRLEAHLGPIGPSRRPSGKWEGDWCRTSRYSIRPKGQS